MRVYEHHHLEESNSYEQTQRMISLF